MKFSAVAIYCATAIPLKVLHGDFHSKYKFMENSRINFICYWNNRIKNSSGVFELVFFFMSSRKKCIKNKQKIFDCFWEKKEKIRKNLIFIN